MIYIFSWPKEFCKAFAVWKRGIGCHKPPATKKPLNTFAALQGCMSLAALYVCSWARQYTDTECVDGDEDVVLGFETFTNIVTCMAIVGLLFAAYVFMRFWNKVLALNGTEGYPYTTLQPADDQKYKMINVPLKTIRAAFKQMMLYDPVVLIYFLCALAVAILSLMAPNSLTHAADCPHAEQVRGWGMAFLWVDALYVPLFYYCCPNRNGVDAEIPWPEGEGPSVAAAA
jgi:hypothetical protein